MACINVIIKRLDAVSSIVGTVCDIGQQGVKKYLKVTPDSVWVVFEYETSVEVESNVNWEIA